MQKALLLYGATDAGSPHFSGDMLWRAGFRAPDPFFLAEIEEKTFLLLSPLEVERGAKESKADQVILIDEYARAASRKTQKEAVAVFLKERGVEAIIIPEDFPYALGRFFGSLFSLETKKPVYPARAEKTDWEIEEITKAQRSVEKAMQKAVELLRSCRIEGDRVYPPTFNASSQKFSTPFPEIFIPAKSHTPREGGRVYFEDGAITSEVLRDTIDTSLYEEGYLAIGTIVSCGAEASDPHALGKGALLPHAPIVIDIFPFSMKTHYYSDQTRTIFKGEPSEEFKNMYQAVLGAQERALAMVRAGQDGYGITKEVEGFFEAKGYPTDTTKRPLEGFFHGVGHGVGIDIHEFPRIGRVPTILQERNVVTVEPGLYYSRAREHIPAGGIRIEDIVVVEKNGCRNLTKFPKKMEDAIII